VLILPTLAFEFKDVVISSNFIAHFKTPLIQ
jgi:hypothetical protein